MHTLHTLFIYSSMTFIQLNNDDSDIVKYFIYIRYGLVISITAFYFNRNHAKCEWLPLFYVYEAPIQE